VNSCASLCRRHFIGWLEIWTANRWRMFRKKKSRDMAITRGRFRHYDYDRMVVRKRHARSAPLPWTTWMIDWKASITTLPVRTFCGMLKSGLGEGTTAVCRTVSKSTALQLCL
jgi:hypothetical protein